MAYVCRTCKVCGTSFRCRESNTKRVWCSEQCCKILNMKTCPLCGKKFLQNRNQKYCNGPHWKTCPQCNKPFDCTKNPKQMYCSTKCRGVYEAEHNIRKQISEKAKHTVQQRYGSDCVAHIPGVQDKKKQTCLKRYGVEHVWLDSDIQAKRRNTLFQKYGASGPMSDKQVQQKAKRTSLQRYGVEHPAQSSEIKNKTREHFKQKYGVEAAMQVPEFKEKYVATSMQRYGVPWAYQTKEAQAKAANTIKQRYGNSVYQRTEDYHNKFRNTMLAHYGVESPMQSGMLKTAAESTCMLRYGTKHACLVNQSETKSISAVNRAFSDYLLSNGIYNELEYALPDKAYDVKVESTLIELNPTYTHNSIGSHFNLNGLPVQYHAERTKYAADNGYRCIHVWDWDDWDKVLYILPTKKTAIGARLCTVQCVSKNDTNIFLNKYHLQGSCKGQMYCYGLYYNNELVAVMTFGKPRYNKKFEYELLRLCFKPGIEVLGGSKRMFKHFISDMHPTSIISYCDNSKFTGAVYKRLGMQLEDKGQPTKHWYSSKKSERMQHITDNFLRQRGFDQIFETCYGKGTSNEELMLARGYLPVYDCGQSRYTWNTTQA